MKKELCTVVITGLMLPIVHDGVRCAENLHISGVKFTPMKFDLGELPPHTHNEQAPQRILVKYEAGQQENVKSHMVTAHGDAYVVTPPKV